MNDDEVNAYDIFCVPCSKENASKNSRKACCCHQLPLFPLVEIWFGFVFGFVSSFVVFGLVCGELVGSGGVGVVLVGWFLGFLLLDLTSYIKCKQLFSLQSQILFL